MKISVSQPVRSFDSQTANPSPVILLVEDESIVREVTREVLEHAGYRVLSCDGPDEALRTAAEHQGRIGLLLTDVIMPGMNGADMACRLQGLQPGLITVFMSGYADFDVLHEIKRTSVLHIQKPFTVKTLLSRVAEALSSDATTRATSNLPGVSA